MKLDRKTVLFGTVAGFAAAILSISVMSQTMLSLLLGFASSLPIFIAGLGWGVPAAVIATIVATVSIGFLDVANAFVQACTTFLPAAWISSLVLLARPAEDPQQVEWYPVSNIFMNLVLATCFGIAACGLALGYTLESAGPRIREGLEAIRAASPQYAEMIRPDMIDDLVPLAFQFFPMMLAGVSVLILAINLLLAGSLTRSSGLLDRTSENLPRNLGLPVSAALIFGAGLLGLTAFAANPGSISLISALLVGGLGMAFALVGLSTIHFLSKGNPIRGLLLFGIYMLIFVLSLLPLSMIAALGVAEVLLRLKDRKARMSGNF